MRNKVFSAQLILLYILGLGVFVLPQHSGSHMEKRFLHTNRDFQLDKIYSSTEKILEEQFYFRDQIIKQYYSVRIYLNKSMNYIFSLSRIRRNNLDEQDKELEYEIYSTPIEYLSSEVIELKDGYLSNAILNYTEDEISLSAQRGYNINEFDLKYPQIKTYVYFPTRVEELLNPEYDYMPVCQYSFLKQLNPNISYSNLQLNNILDYQKYYYASDTHWNALGAYVGYQDIIKMIGSDYDIEPIKTPTRDIEYPFEFHGNISNKIGSYGKTDRIKDYEFEDIGNFDYYINNKESSCGLEKDSYAHFGNSSYYSDYDYYFGDNYFLREFDFQNDSKPNLIIFGDSFINTNMMWIASHFNHTYIIDLRTVPNDFSLNNFISSHNIDIALVCYYYNNLYFNGDCFIPVQE